MLPIEMFEKGDFLKDSPKSPLEKRPVKNLNLRNIQNLDFDNNPLSNDSFSLLQSPNR